MTDRVTYFISYTHDKGLGNAEVSWEHPISSFEDVRKIEKLLAQDSKVPRVLIIFYTLLDGPGQMKDQ